MRKNKKNFGFTIMEVIIACSIITICMFTLMQTASMGIAMSHQSLSKLQAGLLLEEGSEAVKSIRDENWNNISGLSLNTPYYLNYNTTVPNAWSLGLTPSVIDSTFTRTVRIFAVNRDTNDNIVNSGGVLDPHSKKIIINVDWQTRNGIKSNNLTFYIFDIFN